MSNQPSARISISAAMTLLALATLLASFHPVSARAHKDHVKPTAEELPAPPVVAVPTDAAPELPSAALSGETRDSRTDPAAEVHDHGGQPVAEAHDHSTGHSSSQPDSVERDGEDGPANVPQPLAWLGKFHPPVTHFPIALISAAALAELLFVRRRTALFEHATRFCVWLGTSGALLAALLGWFFAGFQLVDDEWVMTTHRWLGTATALWAVLVFVLCERAYTGTGSRRPFQIALFAGTGFVSATGFFGGALIYGLDHFAR